MEEFKKEIEFQDVEFKYDENYVLNKINFKVKKGEMVAIVGASEQRSHRTSVSLFTIRRLP